MKVVLPGGSGQVGGILARALAADGHDVVTLSRCGRTPHPGRAVAWDGRTHGAWTRELDGADVVINLAGRSVDCRYTDANRREIMDSRLASTWVLGEAIAAAGHPPRVWLQSSTATIYEHRFDRPNDERTGILGGDEPDAPDTWKFSIDVARSWEAAALAVGTPHTRVVLLRSAMVMSPDRGGVFDTLLRLVRFGLGGTSASGRQFISWIHHADFVRAIRLLIEREELDGPVNLSAPEPLPNRDFMRALREAWGAKVGLPANRWMLEVGAFAMRTETELVLKSRRVTPTRLLDAGFAFEHPAWSEAARELVADWRR